MSICTRTGDDGTTGLLFNRRVPKHGPRLEAYGTVDEFTAALGLARCLTTGPDNERLLAIQHDLIPLMGELAVLPEDVATYRERGYPPFGTGPLEKVDAWVKELEDGGAMRFEGWVIPGANPISAALDFARVVCRRAERRVSVLAESSPVDAEIPRYLNRLSDLLWLLARKFEQGDVA